VDLPAEAALLRFLCDATAAGLLRSAQDVSGGGLAVAIAECSIWGDVGADLVLTVASVPALELFGEGPGRVVVTVAPERADQLAALAHARAVPVRRLGTTGGERLCIRLTGEGASGAAEERGAGVADVLDEPIDALRDAWERGLPRALGEEPAPPPVEREGR
jgi:phosphoribosylformylglycinamidine synthase